jgi:hypothetical protein
VLEAGATSVPSASPSPSPKAAGDAASCDIRNLLSATERPLGTKATRRKKRCLESSSTSQADMASSVRDFSEAMKRADEQNARMQIQKLRLQEQSNRLRMYETLFLRESSTASEEERQLAESQMRSMFFSSLLHEGSTSIDAGSLAVPPPPVKPHTPADPPPPVDIASAPLVHGCTMVDTQEAGQGTSQRAVGNCVDVPHVHGHTEPTQLSKSLDDDSDDDEN